LNWNRTPSHQLWGKYSQMDAVVSNLFYLGVDGGGQRRHGGQAVHARPDLDAQFEHRRSTRTFGFSRQNQNVMAGTSRSGNFGAGRAGHPGDQRRRRPRESAMPATPVSRRFNTGFSAIGNNAGWNPLYRDERTYAFSDQTSPSLMGQARSSVRLRRQLPLSGPLAAGDVDTPRGDFNFNGSGDASCSAPGTADPEPCYNQYAQFLLGLFHDGVQGRPVRGDDRARVAARLSTCAIGWNVSEQGHARPGLRYEYYPLMTRADRGIEHGRPRRPGALPSVFGGLWRQPRRPG
jgi:hypothetical protein